MGCDRLTASAAHGSDALSRRYGNTSLSPALAQ
jgi:hypothetical protein